MSGEKIARCVCGGVPRTRVDGNLCKVVCRKCGRTTGWMSPASEAIDCWNYKAKKEAK